jgi:hypothetical protein
VLPEKPRTDHGHFLSHIRGLRLLFNDKEEDFLMSSDEDGWFPVHLYMLNGLLPFVERSQRLKQRDGFCGLLRQTNLGFRQRRGNLLVVSSIYEIPELNRNERMEKRVREYGRSGAGIMSARYRAQHLSGIEDSLVAIECRKQCVSVVPGREAHVSNW